jgi:hypothetical protein
MASEKVNLPNLHDFRVQKPICASEYASKLMQKN